MDKVIYMHQVHGNSIVRVYIKDTGETIPNCDALISDDPNVTLAVFVADCLPISVNDKNTHSFGLIHAGWRGLANKIIEKTVKKMVSEFAADPPDIAITIGPHICQKHFAVKDDVLGKFKDYPEALLVKNGKQFLDLTKIAELQLISLGVKKENIKIDERCTYEDKKLFSYRRNKTIFRNVFKMGAKT